MVRFDLPWDLVEEILARVPTTSLTRLGFTCKRWNALFKDPEFIKKHLDKAGKPYSVLLLSCFRVYSLSVNINTIHNNPAAVDPSIVFTAKLSRNLKESEEVKITQVFHCNGLLLCSTKEKEKTKLVVVNPCTGQTRWIKPRSVYDIFDDYALGYENNKKHSYDSYKILRFPAGDRNNLEIIELKSNSWRVLLANIPAKVKHPALRRDMSSVKGNAYWLRHPSWSLTEFDILSFDFATERFRSLCLPSVFKNSKFAALSDVREEKLALLHWRLDNEMPQLEIWMSNEIDDTETVLSWSKSFKFDLHSDIDFRFLRSVSFFIDEEKKVIVCCDRSEENNKNMIYIVGKHGCRKFDTNQSSHWPWVLFGYVPSLVSLNPPINEGRHHFKKYRDLSVL